MAHDWDEAEDAHKKVYHGRHGAKLSHELIAAAVAFGAFKLFEDHQRKKGKSISHHLAKEALVSLIAGELDKLAESKGLGESDRHEAHKGAKENAERMYDDHYVKHHGADKYDPERYGRHEKFEKD